MEWFRLLGHPQIAARQETETGIAEVIRHVLRRRIPDSGNRLTTSLGWASDRARSRVGNTGDQGIPGPSAPGLANPHARILGILPPLFWDIRLRDRAATPSSFGIKSESLGE
ncbi:hypothetical protein GCM10008959_40840 [Deinococcus seoulensis]|uniref:Uncharacterized protein n=1 Tax=Deinococcus seoulensis TaxID=1837379 RepID=A0ABQ2RXE5_9DEIO|nr:hypothetical protein GCM10008959_40840 [Deinococcus seoulensis]